jgi:hypothetical protein
MEEKLQPVLKQLAGLYCQILVITVNSIITYKTGVRFNKRTPCPEKNSLTENEQDRGVNSNQAASTGTLISIFAKIWLSTDIFNCPFLCPKNN